MSDEAKITTEKRGHLLLIDRRTSPGRVLEINPTNGAELSNFTLPFTAGQTGLAINPLTGNIWYGSDSSNNVVVKEGRAEVLLEQEPDLAGGFDVVVARSVGPAAGLLPLARQYLKPGGLFVAAGPPNPLSQPPLEIVRVGIPGTRKGRVFLTAVKES
jgi:hypothetical protein